MTCSKCKHSHTDGQSRVCRRYPPTVNSVLVPTPPDVRNPNGGVTVANQTLCPTVSDEWVCGEYVARLAGVSLVT